MRRITPQWGLVAAVTAALTAWGYSRTYSRYFTEWNYFEFAARRLVNYHDNPLYRGDPLRLYVDNPQLQIGPPALWPVAGLQGLPGRVVATVFVVVMALLGLLAVSAVLATGRTVLQRPTLLESWPLAVAAATVAGVWGYDCGTWRHLDDSLALCATAAACLLIARSGRWWLIGLLLGTAVAAKPWALVLVPVVLGLPRPDIARTTLVVIVTAGAWWAPFLLAAPDTSSALGRYIVVARPGSVLHLLGVSGPVQGWLRPTQFVVGSAVGVLVAQRHRWTAVPLAALAVRVLTDPYDYAYYGLGPMLAAFLYDSTSERGRQLPLVTAVTVVVEFVLPPLGLGDAVTASTKLLWGVGVLLLVALPRRRTPVPA